MLWGYYGNPSHFEKTLWVYVEKRILFGNVLYICMKKFTTVLRNGPFKANVLKENNL